MRLPNTMKRENRRVRETAVFGGLDRREGAGAWTLTGCENLSPERFPCLSPRAPRQLFGGVTDADDVCSRNGKLVLCRGGKLYYDGSALCDVLPGKKQFVTVNSKLVVWPDKLLIDEITGSVRKMDAAVTSAGVDTEMTDHTITIPVHPRIEGQALPTTLTANASRTGFWFRVYTDLAWDAENGYTWDSAEWREIADGDQLKVGDVLIPAVNGSTIQAQVHATADYQTEPGDEDMRTANGIYLIVSQISGNGITYNSGRTFDLTVSFTMHSCSLDGRALTSCFRKGDAVTVSGHPVSRNNRENLFLTDVTEDTLSFAEGSFLPCTAYAELGSIHAGKEPAVAKTAATVYQFDWLHTDNEHLIRTKAGGASLYVKARAGQKILVDESGATPVLWLMEEDETLHELVYYAVSYDRTYHTLLPRQSAYPLRLTVTRSVPQLDYVCEKDNRLWGVVNHQSNRMWDRDAEKWVSYESRMIVASSLGMPDDFYDYSGAYSGAYAVAVASEGNFTGICAMDGDVLCWKEDRLHKVLGSYPANYQTAEFRIPGVLAGAHRTLAAEAGTLVYLGRDGIYAFDGGTPRLLSEPLGDLKWASGAAAWDGDRAVFSLTDGAGAGSLLVYDAAHGLWLREDGAKAVFCRHAGALLMLTDDGKLFRRDAGTEKVSWQATLTPFRAAFGERERGAGLKLRAELKPGSELAAYCRRDGGGWELAGRMTGTGTKALRISPEPFEQLELRLAGTGECTVRGLSLVTRVERT